MPRDEPDSSILPTRMCANDCGTSLEGKRSHARYCSDACRLEAHQRRAMRADIRTAQEHSVADVERQLASGADHVFVEGRSISREAAWAAAAGIRATWAIEGAVATGKVIHEQGQWWVLAQVPLGQFPG